MTTIMDPRSNQGSFIYSLAIHGVICGAVLIGMRVSLSPEVSQPQFVDLGYQELEAPPPPVMEEKKMRFSATPKVAPVPQVTPDQAPRELQDDQGEVAGTQEAKVQNDLGANSQGTAISTPYYKIKPKYPKAALATGVEGWVMMEIDITESGEVENIRVIDGEQRNMFQAEAKRAVAQWRYRPFLDGSGNPVKKLNHQVRVDFTLKEMAEAPGDRASL